MGTTFGDAWAVMGASSRTKVGYWKKESSEAGLVPKLCSTKHSWNLGTVLPPWIDFLTCEKEMISSKSWGKVKINAWTSTVHWLHSLAHSRCEMGASIPFVILPYLWYSLKWSTFHCWKKWKVYGILESITISRGTFGLIYLNTHGMYCFPLLGTRQASNLWHDPDPGVHTCAPKLQMVQQGFPREFM